MGGGECPNTRQAFTITGFSLQKGLLLRMDTPQDAAARYRDCASCRSPRPQDPPVGPGKAWAVIAAWLPWRGMLLRFCIEVLNWQGRNRPGPGTDLLRATAKTDPRGQFIAKTTGRTPRSRAQSLRQAARKNSAQFASRELGPPRQPNCSPNYADLGRALSAVGKRTLRRRIEL